MTETATAPVPAETPSDEAQPRTRIPKRATRYQVLEGGDYRVLQVHPGDEAVAAGSLVPLPDSPGFEDSTGALNWIRREGARLSGLQLAIVRYYRLLAVQAVARPVVDILEKPRKVITGPEAEQGG